MADIPEDFAALSMEEFRRLLKATGMSDAEVDNMIGEDTSVMEVVRRVSGNSLKFRISDLVRPGKGNIIAIAALITGGRDNLADEYDLLLENGGDLQAVAHSGLAKAIGSPAEGPPRPTPHPDHLGLLDKYGASDDFKEFKVRKEREAFTEWVNASNISAERKTAILNEDIEQIFWDEENGRVQRIDRAKLIQREADLAARADGPTSALAPTVGEDGSVGFDPFSILEGSGAEAEANQTIERAKQAAALRRAESPLFLSKGQLSQARGLVNAMRTNTSLGRSGDPSDLRSIGNQILGSTDPADGIPGSRLDTQNTLGLDPEDLGFDPDTFFRYRDDAIVGRFGDNPQALEFGQDPRSADMWSFSEARDLLFMFSEEHLEQVQRKLWQAGYYGEGAILNAQTPNWGFIESDTSSAWMNFLLDVFAEEGGDVGTVLERQVRANAGRHEQALILNSGGGSGRSFSSRAFVDPDPDGVAAQVRSAIEPRIGRDVDDTEIEGIVNAVINEIRGQQQATHDIDVSLFHQQQGPAGSSTAVDSLGFPVGAAPTSGRARDYDIPIGPTGSNPSEGLTENNIQAALRGLRWLESGDPDGNYSARNRGSSAGGAYQFVDSTWVAYGGSVTATSGGVGNGHASNASREEQDRIARRFLIDLYNRFGNWGDALKGWYYPAWVGTPREGEVPPGANTLSVSEYGEIVWDRAFGRQAQQLPPADARQQAVSQFTPEQLIDMGHFGVDPTQMVTQNFINENGQGLAVPSQVTQTPQLFNGQLPNTSLVRFPEFNEAAFIQDQVENQFAAEITAETLSGHMSTLRSMLARNSF